MSCPTQQNDWDFSIEITTTNITNITVTLNGSEAPHAVVPLGGNAYRLDFSATYYADKTGRIRVKDSGHQIACRELV